MTTLLLATHGAVADLKRRNQGAFLGSHLCFPGPFLEGEAPVLVCQGHVNEWRMLVRIAADLEIGLTSRKTEAALEDASLQPTSRLEDIYPLHNHKEKKDHEHLRRFAAPTYR